MNFKIFLLGGFLLATLVGYASSANILFVEFLGSKSHKITYMHLVEELGKRGHTITTLTGIKPFKVMKNVKEIYTFDAMKEFVYGDKENTFNPFEVKEKGQQNMDPTTMITMATKTCEKSLDLPQVKELLKEKFDLVIFQPGFNDCVLGLIYRLQAPFALFVPTYIPSFILSKVGGHHPTSFNPNVWLGYSSEMTFMERFFNFGTDVIAEAFLKFLYQPQIEKIYREKLGQDIPSINEIYANASLILANTHFTLTGPRPNFPDVVDVGGIHSRPAKALPKDLEDFIKKGDCSEI